MADTSQYVSVGIDRYQFCGFYGCGSCCALEILRAADGRTVVIAPRHDAGFAQLT